MTLWFTLLGLLVGSVAVHVAEAIMTHRRMTLPVCPHCTNPAPWSQWSATLAYVSGRAHCPHCGAKVRSARLAGELLLAATWGLLIWRFGLSPRVMLTMVATIPLAMLMVTDLETRRIPNLITFPATGAMLLLGTFIGTAFLAAVSSMPEIQWATPPGYGAAYSGPGGRERTKPTFEN